MENVLIRKGAEKDYKSKDSISQLRTDIREILEQEIILTENVTNQSYNSFNINNIN